MNWLIWSNEHSAWWGPNRRGYVQDRNEAGRYTHQEAEEIVHSANEYQHPDEKPNEAMLPDTFFKDE